MFKIIKDGNPLAIVGKPTWVRMQENGSFGLTDKDNAHGVALDGKVFHVAGLPEIEGTESVAIMEVDDGLYAGSLTTLIADPADQKNAEHFRKVVQLFAGSLGEETAMEVATIYPAYEVGKAYAVGDYFTFGVNNVGDPQLYKVIQAHTSQADWVPDQNRSLYAPIGLTEEGYAEWSQPTGAADAYNEGDVVSYNGSLYRSTMNGNVWSPDTYPAGWEAYSE